MKKLWLILSFCFCQDLFANTIIVGKDQVITSLRKAVEIARNDDTILLKKGVYKEGNIVIRKSIRLIDAQYVIVENNIIEHSYFAIHVANVQNSIIENNIIKGSPKTEQTSG